MGPQTVVIVVPNWNLRSDLAACLDSLATSTYPDHQVIVVDNASTDDSVAYVRGHYPHVQIISLPENRGYAAALNAGIACALAGGAGYVLALNNDTIMPPDTLAQLVGVLAANPDIGIATPKILIHQRPDRLWNLGDKISPWLPLPRSYGVDRPDGPQFGGLMAFDYVTGCAMLIPCRVFAEVGLFDESLFLFYEDSDFCRRVRERGYRIVAVGYAPLYHKVSVSTGGKNEGYTLRIRARNRIRFYRRYRHGPAPAFTALAIVVMAAWRTAGYLLRRRELVRPYLGGLLEGWREPLTGPVYAWPPACCLEEQAQRSDEVAHVH